MGETQPLPTYVPDETEEAFHKERVWTRRNELERLRIAVRGAGLDSSDAEALISLIDEAMSRT